MIQKLKCQIYNFYYNNANFFDFNFFNFTIMITFLPEPVFQKN